MVAKFGRYRVPKDVVYEAQIKVLLGCLKAEKEHFKFTDDERARLLAAGAHLNHQVDD